MLLTQIVTFSAYIFSALVLDILVVSIVKTVVRRRRPIYNIQDMRGSLTAVDQFSFPSGHTTRVVMLAFFLIKRFHMNTVETCLAALWASSVASSRVMLGRHHVLDVLCGVVIGIAQYRLVEYLWLPPQTVISILQPIQEELHM